MRTSFFGPMGITAGLFGLFALVACSSSPQQTTGGTGATGGGGTKASATTGAATGGSGGGEVYPAPHPAPPVVHDLGGPTLASPTFVPVFFSNDNPTLVGELKTFMTEVGPSTWWATAGKEYGIGAPTVLPPVNLTETATGTIDDSAIQTWLTGKLNSNDPAFPPAAEGMVVTIFYPQGVTITQGSSLGCSAFLGYHASVVLDAAHGNQEISYAVMVRCQTTLDSVTQTVSHEMMEAATDPYPLMNPAYDQLDDDHVLWERILGGEVGDLCDVTPSFGTFSGLDGTVQRIWSNKSAAAGHDPCVPAPAGPYFVAVPVLPDAVQTTVLGAPITTHVAMVEMGTPQRIDLVLYSDAPTLNPWTVTVSDWAALQGKPAELSFTLDKTTGSNGDTLHLTITVVSPSTTGYEYFYVTSTGVATTLHPPTNSWIGVVATPATAMTCAGASSSSACDTCCSDLEPAGAQLYTQAFDQGCACAAGATCNAKCTTTGNDLCATPAQNGSSACYTCLDGVTNESCAMQAGVACQADPGCNAWLTCRAGCPTTP